MDENSMSDEDESLTYEQLRAKRIKKNQEMLDLLGVSQAVKTLTNSLKKKPVAKKNEPKPGAIEPVKRSIRIANLPNPLSSYYPDLSIAIPGRSWRKRQKKTVKKGSYFVEKLIDGVAIKEPVNDFHMLPSKKFVHVLGSLDMNKPPIKVSEFGIQSLAIHPSETSLILASGDRKGNISLYTINSEMQMFMVHKAQVKCISFCTWDPNKLFSTSHDGSVGCGDTVKDTFDIIYKSERKSISGSNINHTTWHSECERNLLIGNSSGHVDMIDTRIPDKIINTAWCHKRSVCTVQCHPLLKHYFLTSSEIGVVSLWDIRSMTDKHINPVLRFRHPKELTSSFFSADGTKMVSTCIDNNIRIFNTEQFNSHATKPTCIIPYFRQYYDHSLQAKWNPGRNDAFFITSMLLPTRMQIYDCDGNILQDLYSKNMKSRCIVMEVHPTQAIYVGGNTYDVPEFAKSLYELKTIFVWNKQGHRLHTNGNWKYIALKLFM